MRIQYYIIPIDTHLYRHLMVAIFPNSNPPSHNDVKVTPVTPAAWACIGMTSWSWLSKRMSPVFFFTDLFI